MLKAQYKLFMILKFFAPLLFQFLQNCHYWCFQNAPNKSYIIRVTAISHNKVITGEKINKNPYPFRRVHLEIMLWAPIWCSKSIFVSRMIFIVIIGYKLSAEDKIIHNNRRIREGNVLSHCLVLWSLRDERMDLFFFPPRVSHRLRKAQMQCKFLLIFLEITFIQGKWILLSLIIFLTGNTFFHSSSLGEKSLCNTFH